MSIYKRNQQGTPGWRARCGQVAAQEKSRRWHLVNQGKASLWTPLRTLDKAIEAAGI